MTAVEELKTGFCKDISFQEKRPGVLQVYAPIFHEDGDMIDLFVDLPRTPGGLTKVSDHGLTLMKLSYDFDIDTENKRRLLARILNENGISEDNGELFVEAGANAVLPAFLQMAQTVAKVTNLQYLKRQLIQSLFYEQLDGFVGSFLGKYNPIPEFRPLRERPDLEVDWKLTTGGKDVFVYGIKDGAKARLAAVSCLEFQRRNISFTSIAVHEDFESGLSKRDQSIITNAADKQFTSLDSFRISAEQFLEREAA